MRVVAGLTQAELANESGVPRVTIARVESGHRISLANYMKLAKFFRCSVEDLVDRNGESEGESA